MYIYPDHLKAKATMWLWQLRDLTIVGVGVLLSVLAITQTGIVIPAILTAVYAFLMIRFEDIKRIMAVYYEQNVTSEKFEDFDGERWIIPDD